MKYYKRSLDPENYQCGHQQPYNFFSVFTDFPVVLTTQENQNQSIRSRKISCNQLKRIFQLSQNEKLLEPIKKKSPYFVIFTSEPVSANMSVALFW